MAGIGGSVALASLCGQSVAPTAGIEFSPLGRLAPRPAREIDSSAWSVGGETLDRDFAVYDNYKSYLGPLGAKSIRLQAGWAKTERTPGVYRWGWLDGVIDDALAQGVQPWLQLSYGNPIYPGGGSADNDKIALPSGQALEAWDAWVRAAVQHYGTRVCEWEVWNEPDVGGKVTAEQYAAFFLRTAKLIRQEQPKAKIDALALAHRMDFADVFLARVKAQGQLGLIDAITIHGYPENPDDTEPIDRLREIAASYSPGIAIRQGESGAPSADSAVGALREGFSETVQAKWDLRRMLAHRGKDVPCSVFTLMDLKYLSGKSKGLNPKGLLKANADLTVAYAKPAYSAVQAVTAVFDATLERLPVFPFSSTPALPVSLFAYARARTDAQIVAVWRNDRPPAESNRTIPVKLAFSRANFVDPVYVDLRTGLAYAFPAGSWSHQGSEIVFSSVPIYDSPVLIAERSAVVLRR